MTPPSPTIDLNADLGEGFPNDEAILAFVTSASISCGAHAGDPDTIRSTLLAALRAGVAVGAHPGYPDREHFGRRTRNDDPKALETLVSDQISSLAELARSCSLVLRYVKPHGALYNQAQDDPAIAHAIVRAVSSWGLPILGLPGGHVESEAGKVGLRFLAEGFPERGYSAEGRLLDRSLPGAVLTEPAQIETQVLALAARGVQTLCIHGDDPQAVAKARHVHSTLLLHGITPRFWG